MTPIPLATTRWGSGDKRALLVHGIMSSAEGWWRLAPDLVSAGYEVTAVDLRGHGASPRGDTMALEAYSADVGAVGESWDLVLGHSMGGAIALMVLAANPGWTETLILEDPALTITDQPLAMEWFTAPWSKPIDRATIASENPRWHPREFDIKVDALRQCGRETMVRTVNDAVPWDVRGLAETVPVPTLLLGADPDLDPIITPHLGAAIAAASPHIQYEPVTGGSHSMHRDAYDEFWAIIDRFLAGIAG